MQWGDSIKRKKKRLISLQNISLLFLITQQSLQDHYLDVGWLVGNTKTYFRGRKCISTDFFFFENSYFPLNKLMIKTFFFFPVVIHISVLRNLKSKNYALYDLGQNHCWYKLSCSFESSSFVPLLWSEAVYLKICTKHIGIVHLKMTHRTPVCYCHNTCLMYY